MSDRLTREFRAKLTTTMDSVMRTTMFEIMRIFENSLSDFQTALVQRGEEIAHLKIKLQRTELRLKDIECGGDKAEEKSASQENQMKKEPEDVTSPSEKPSHVPEFDFEGKTFKLYKSIDKINCFILKLLKILK